MISQELIIAYNIKEKLHNVYIFLRVTKVMYGLPQAGIIEHDALFQDLGPYIYHPSIKNPVIWNHDSFPINFTLVIGDLCVRYSLKEHSLHLKSTLQDK